ncbi:hypothetical protein ACIQVR_26875 [Streptomyces xanthochromogenes]|uniref:hypothetical protein n=1 Tax=Streptomyces xanthochromogenes TaxID=67384 RepID=UPI00382AAC0A
MKELEYQHPDADVLFTWDGWMQVMIRTGPSVPWGAYRDRFDIREPDLRIKNFFNDGAYDPSVHFVPRTQQGFETMCNDFFHGRETGPGLRDYTQYPWKSRSWGVSTGALEFRYTGGAHIEMTPAEQNHWLPVIELAASGRTLTQLTTKWLMGRCHGWELAVFEALGVTGASKDFEHAHTAWVKKHRPAVGKQSIGGNWREWIYDTMRRGWQSGRVNDWADLGGNERHVGDHPWHAQRTDADGNRWNFTWNGAPYAYVYSSDLGKPLPEREYLWLLRPETQAGEHDVFQWLDKKADEWVSVRPTPKS